MKKTSDNKSILKKEFTIPFFNMKNMKKIISNIRNRKKSHICKKKRKTFGELFAKNALIGLLLTIVFAVGLFTIGKEYIFSKAESYTSYNMNSIRNGIEMETDSENHIYKDISSIMRIHAGYSIVLDNKNAKHQINTANTKNCHVFSCIADENGNIIYSSRKTLQTYMTFEKEETFVMSCDTENKDIPELQQFEEDYNKFMKKQMHDYKAEENICIDIAMKSAYINKEERTFIPHEIAMSLTRFYPDNSEPDEIIETKEYNIDIPEDYGYELVEFDLSGLDRYRISNDTYPRYFGLNYSGTDKEWFDNIKEKYVFNSNFIGGRYGGGNTRQYQQNVKIHIDGKSCILSVVLQINAWNKVTKPLYFRIVIIFLLVVLVIAFLDAWRLNVRNQADYMFEDYQKNLTNSLAHDIKTPLMAIGGYTENILTGGLSGEETTNYLKSIMDSVAYTDSIITRTLELNRMKPSDDIHKESTDVNRIIEECLEKHSLALDERNITVNITGNAEIYANISLLETTIENLISNAVKYASENSNINIKISNENLTVTNAVSHKTDVKNIRKPFVKGDKARSNQSGSGLGLAIAETAALTNGFKLILSCTDSAFTAEIKF